MLKTLNDPSVKALLEVVLAMIVAFFLTRMFWLWYFKLDKIESHLAKIADSLNSIKLEAISRNVDVTKVSDERWRPKY